MFKLVDVELNKNFEEELKDLVSEEAKRFKKENEDKDIKNLTSMIQDIPTEESTTENVITDRNNENIESNIEDNQENSRLVREDRNIQSEEKSVNTNIENLKYWNNLDDEDKKDIITNMEDFNGSDILWKSSTRLIPCDDCSKELPSTVLNCPYCGKHFESN